MQKKNKEKATETTINSVVSILFLSIEKYIELSALACKPNQVDNLLKNVCSIQYPDTNSLIIESKTWYSPYLFCLFLTKTRATCRKFQTKN